MSTAIDDLLVGGAAGKGLSFKDKPIGTSYGGPVVSAEVRAYTDIQTGKPEFWDDGGPKQQIVIGIQTDDRDPSIENDDGVRYAYIKAWGKQKQSFRAAAQTAGGSPVVGDFFGVKLVGTEASKTRGFSDTKLYEYTIRKSNPVDAVVGSSAQPAAAPQVAAAQSGAEAPAQQAQIEKLAALGLSDEQIIAALDGVSEADVTVVRFQMAAVSGKGF